MYVYYLVSDAVRTYMDSANCLLSSRLVPSARLLLCSLLLSVPYNVDSDFTSPHP